MDENNMNPMGPDPNLFSGQPQQPQFDQAQPQQPQFNQAQPQQPGFQPQQPQFDQAQPQQPQQPGFQPQGQPGVQQPGGPGMVYQDPAYGQPPQQPGGPGMGQPGAPQPPKKGNVGLIIGIIAAVVVLIGVLVGVLISSRNINGAKDVSLKFVESIGNLDFQSALECVPEELRDNEDFGFVNGDDEEMQQTIDLLKGFGFSIDDVEITSAERLDKKDIKEKNADFNTENGTNVKFKNAAKVDVTGIVSMSFLGQEKSEDLDFSFICAKIKGKWYIVDVDDHGEGILDGEEELEEEEEEAEAAEAEAEEQDTEEEDATEASEDAEDVSQDDEESSDGEDISSIEDVLDKSTAESHVVDVPDGVSDDPADLTFSFEGDVYTITFPVADLGSDWVCEESYFYKEDEELDAGDTASTYNYDNSKYDDYFYLYIGTCNTTEDTIAYKDSDVRSIDADIAYCDEDNYPEMILSKGITWHSSLQDIYDAYGEPSSLYEGYDGEYIYLYYYFDHSDELCLTVDYEDGVTGIEYYGWSWNY